jgi:hypothetical protein
MAVEAPRRALGLLMALASLVGWTGACGRDEAFPAAPPTLPELALSPRTAAAVTRIELSRPDDEDPTRRSTIVLERSGEAWRVTAPLRTPASADKVAALLANLCDLHLWKRLDPGVSFYDQYDLSDAKALHVVAQTGMKATRRTVVDFFAGRSSLQGQLVRLPGTPGMFAMVNEGAHGYQGFLYTRDLRSWRDPSVLSFDEAQVDSVEIANGHGLFAFTRQGAGWAGTFAPRRRDGAVGRPRPRWIAFDGTRVDELLRAYHALAADDFGDPGDKAAAGLDRAEMIGGVVRIHLRRSPGPLELRVGLPAPERSRFAIAGSRWGANEQSAGDDTLYVLSPWTARWALADPRLFER